MMTKGLSRKQVLVPMSFNNLDKFIILSSKHVANINRALKNIKSDVIADFIWANSRGLKITINKVMFTLDLITIEKCWENIKAVDSNDIILPRLP